MFLPRLISGYQHIQSWKAGGLAKYAGCLPSTRAIQSADLFLNLIKPSNKPLELRAKAAVGCPFTTEVTLRGTMLKLEVGKTFARFADFIFEKSDVDLQGHYPGHFTST